MTDTRAFSDFAPRSNEVCSTAQRSAGLRAEPPCTNDELVLYDEPTSVRAPEKRIVAGFYAGRTRDRSELAVFEELELAANARDRTPRGTARLGKPDAE